MSRIEKIISRMKNNPKGVSFADLCIVCEHFFGPPRQKWTSHRVYKTPWPGKPQVNLQSDHGMAKGYQVKQALIAIERLSELNNEHR